jgi:hypothetical protein
MKLTTIALAAAVKTKERPRIFAGLFYALFFGSVTTLERCRPADGPTGPQRIVPRRPH